MRRGIPEDVKAINAAIRDFLGSKDEQGRVIGRALGAYAFYDYDQEPIYVGQTWEGLNARIGRHMTNQRTDAVAMNVLDPFEVAYIEVWPVCFDKPTGSEGEDFTRLLNAVEYTVFQKVLRESSFGAVLNEADISPSQEVELPRSYRQRIIPESIFEARSHPDIRIARRAHTIASLAQVISSRAVSIGLRRTLLTQARRLERLSALRFAEFKGEPMPVDQASAETGDSAAEGVSEE